MNDSQSNAEHSVVTTAPPQDDEIHIVLPERFVFETHRRFRAGYYKHGHSGRSYVVDFRLTRFIDSAGLGMLLQLSEHIERDSSRLRFINVTSDISATLLVAGFDQLATIQ